jgi:hypothetical protein
LIEDSLPIQKLQEELMQPEEMDEIFLEKTYFPFLRLSYRVEFSFYIVKLKSDSLDL